MYYEAPASLSLHETQTFRQHFGGGSLVIDVAGRMAEIQVVKELLY